MQKILIPIGIPVGLAVGAALAAPSVLKRVFAVPQRAVPEACQDLRVDQVSRQPSAAAMGQLDRLFRFHQVNLEYLAKVVWDDGETLYPDSLVGTDSHTTMINGLGVVGWGVGGIEAEAVIGAGDAL